MEANAEGAGKIASFVARLDEAMACTDEESLCAAVKDALKRQFAEDPELLGPAFLAPSPGAYARRLLHKCPQNRYSVVVMVWDRGQGTLLHDHAGAWCVECVYRGRIRVVSYDRTSDGPDDRAVFEAQKEVIAGVGEAGALIPPFDYHTIENAGDEPAVTIHVYRGELTWSNVFVQHDDGTYEKVRRELSYSA